jgi:hypothetical protein
LNAVAPSRASSEARTGSLIARCSSNIRAAGHSGASRRIRVVARTANGPLAAMVAASSSAAGSASPGVVSRLTSPTS